MRRFWVFVMVLGMFLVGCKSDVSVTSKKTDNGEPFENGVAFKEAVDKIGFGQAVILHENKLQESFWSNLDFDQWCKVFRATERNSKLEKRAICGAIDKSPDVPKTLALYKVASIGSEAEKRAEKKVLSQADSLEEWVAIYILIREGDGRNSALAKVCENCTTFVEWTTIYRVSPDGSALESKCIEGMATHSKTLEEWVLVFVVAPAHSPMEKRAMEEITKLAPPGSGVLPKKDPDAKPKKRTINGGGA